MHGGYDAPAMAEPDPPIPVLEALIALAQVQLTEAWAEVRDQNTYALALAALGIAVIGIVAAIRARSATTGGCRSPASPSSIVALLGTRRARARLGPDPVSFYETFGTTSTQDALAQLLANLVAARTKDVPSVLRRQRIALLAVGGLFAITAVYSTLLLV